MWTVPNLAESHASLTDYRLPISNAQTTIKRIIILFQENVSFDHYFGTYPPAKNPTSEPLFIASLTTPSINGLDARLQHYNPNSTNPIRLDRFQPVT